MPLWFARERRAGLHGSFPTEHAPGSRQERRAWGKCSRSIVTLLAWHGLARTGHLSIAPNASDREAKAAHQLRYAELRWSLDASLWCLNRGD